MIGSIVRAIKEMPLLNELYRRYTENKIANPYKNKAIGEVFHNIYKANKWGGKESVSGLGSDFIQTEIIIKELPKVFKKYNISSVLDIPCGDFHWMKEVDLDNVNYTGGDIVLDIINANNEKYGSTNKKFLHLNLIKDQLPKSDLIFVRDCFVHLPLEDVKAALENIKRSDIQYILTTTFPRTRRNYNITTGNWRPLNLLKKPFKFKQPIELINEGCTESYGQYTDKSLGLWKVSDLPNL